MIEKRRRLGLLKIIFAVRFMKLALIYIVVLLAFNLSAAWKVTAELKECFLASPLLKSNYIISQLSFTGAIIVLIAALLILLDRSLGAVPRIEKILNEVINGNYSLRIKLRKKDIINPLAEKLNKILDLLEKKAKT